MIAVELAAALAAGCQFLGFMFGRVYEARRRRTVHEHVWGNWEECDVMSPSWVDGRRQHTRGQGQKRDCMSCGYRELREVAV